MKRHGPVASVVLLALAAACSKAPPAYYFPPPGQGVEAQSPWTPREAGLDPATIGRLGALAPHWALWRYGHLVHVRGDFNKKANVQSNRKTWHAMLVGAAIQQGRIPSIDQTIGTWNPELAGQHAEATWRHVLTQSSGLDYPYAGFPPYAPGAMWTYSDRNLIELCNALARVYGKRDYRDDYEGVAREALFDAIGLEGWETLLSKQEAGVHFRFDLEDMGRLGLLAASEGNWNGKQLVPKWFVRELETKQTHGMKVNYEGPNDGKVGLDPARFPEAPYGYLTWVNTDGDLYPGADRGWAGAIGASGQITMWNPATGIVFAALGWKPPPDTDAPYIIEAGLRR